MSIKINPQILLSIFSLLVFSCAWSKVIPNPQYQKSAYKEPSMVIILIKTPLVDYHGNVEPEFGPGDQDSLIVNFFKQQLIKDIKSQTSITNIQFDTCTASGSYDSFEIETIGNITKIPVLSNGGHYKCQNSDPTFILILSDLYIGTYDEAFSAMTRTNARRLFYKAQVTLFDNVKQQYIKYGYVNAGPEVKQSFIPVIRIGDWYNISSNFTSIIFAGFKSEQP